MCRTLKLVLVPYFYFYLFFFCRLIRIFFTTTQKNTDYKSAFTNLATLYVKNFAFYWLINMNFIVKKCKFLRTWMKSSKHICF